ncbi:hypothetical protein GLOIN_2v1470985 [Rhizophagus irregularis DAOM 181602=DAOM 197198]|nr:hypothetical protein GLOIN_2v1470985 [Rhizophagus irregularis DAOM 181602=DAOM 197198]
METWTNEVVNDQELKKRTNYGNLDIGSDLSGEHRKNLATLKKCDSEEIKKEKIITVIFMTRAIDPELTYSGSYKIKDL